MNVGVPEIALIVSGLSALAALVAMGRNVRSDTATEAKNLATINAKLGSIQAGVDEIKSDVRQIRSEVSNHAERLVKLEIKVASLEGEKK
jgi:peptidoglycan hydrolase CwlO-like protein